jgi:hypothetical protein
VDEAKIVLEIRKGVKHNDVTEIRRALQAAERGLIDSAEIQAARQYM